MMNISLLLKSIKVTSTDRTAPQLCTHRAAVLFCAGERGCALLSGTLNDYRRITPLSILFGIILPFRSKLALKGPTAI